MSHDKGSRLTNPATWSKSVRQAVDAIATTLMATVLLHRSRAAGHRSSAVQDCAADEQRDWNEALNQRELNLLRGRLECMPPQQRPHYAPESRLEILQLMRLRNWNIERTAQRLVLHTNTIRAWSREFNRAGDVGRFFGAAPFNKISEAGRWLVHQIRELCPNSSFGTRAIAMSIVRAGVQLSRSSVQRILRETKPQRPPAPTARGEELAVVPHHILRPREINGTWHLDLTTLEFFWIRFYVAAIVDGFSRKLLALRVYIDAPATADMLRLVRKCFQTCGAPRFMVTDHGCQFRKCFENGLKPLGISLVKGKKNSKQFNGKVERFFRTFKLWQRVTLFAWKIEWIQRRLDVYREWYNNERRMWIHDGRTPEEVWVGIQSPAGTSLRQNDPLKPAINVNRINFYGDPHLPTLNIQIVRSVQRVA